MMRLVRKGRPVVFHHYCMSEQKGKPMSNDEQRWFLTEVLAECFKTSGNYVDYLHHGKGKFLPDIRQYNALGQTQFNVDYVVVPLGGIEPSEEETSLLIKMYEGTNYILKIIRGALWDIDNDDCNPVMGSNYQVTYRPQTLYPLKEDMPIDTSLTQKDLVEKVLQSWKSLDSSIMSPYFDKEMHYESDWVFNEMSSSLEYMSYIDGKFNAIKKSGSELQLQLAKNTESGDFAILMTQKEYSEETNVLQIETHHGRIVSMHLSELKR